MDKNQLSGSGLAILFLVASVIHLDPNVLLSRRRFAMLSAFPDPISRPMHPLRAFLDRGLLPAALLALLWLVLVDGDAASWLVGIPTVLLAVLALNRLRPGVDGTLRLWVLPGFIIWFLWQSLRGGTDVARRALHPAMPISPGLLEYRLVLPPGPARVFLMNCLTLLPGTLSADLQNDDLVLHALNASGTVLAETREAERQVARLFGIPGESVLDGRR